MRITRKEAEELKLESLLRSPLINAFIFMIIGIIMILLHLHDWVSFYLINALGLIAVAVALGWFVLSYMHNRIYPTRTIKLFTYLPPELREDDEGGKWVTLQAMRKTYILFYIGIPSIMAMMMVIKNSIIVPISGLTLLGILMQIILWYELRKWHRG
jgi:hypothetical protein